MSEGLTLAGPDVKLATLPFKFTACNVIEVIRRLLLVPLEVEGKEGFCDEVTGG